MKLPLPLFVCLMISVGASAAPAQNREGLIDRINKLEEQLNQLKDRPAVAAVGNGEAVTSAVPAGENAAQISVKLSEIQSEIRGFRGKLEEMEHEQRKVNARLDKFERDADARLQALENKAAAAVPVIADSKTETKAPEKVQEKSIVIPSEKPAEVGEKPETKTTVTKPEAGKTAKRIEVGKKEEDGKKPAEAAATKEPAKPEEKKSADAPEKPSADKPASEKTEKVEDAKKPADDGSAKEQYDAAFKLLNQGDYEKARGQFSEFVSKNPSHELVGNAYYWLGETYFIKQQYAKSAEEYRKGFEALPEGPKAPDNLFKLARSLAQDKREKEACVVLAQIAKKYASETKSVVRKAANESKKLKCE